MPTYRAELSVSSLDKLLSDVKAYRDKVNAAPAAITLRLAEIGVEAIQQNIAGIKDPDGNDPGTVGMQVNGGTAKVFQEGPQVAFTEFGTGEQGAASPHPKYTEANWLYGSGKKIRLTKNGKRMWHYFDRLKGHWRTTNGIPAQKQVFKAALTMRDSLSAVAKEALR
jgi:hypothetical protein